MAEHRIVVPVVGGSSPLIHPSSGSRTGPREGVARDRLLGQRRAPSGIRPALRAGNRNSLARLRRAAASSDWSLLIVKGGVFPLSHFPPNTRAANGVRCRLFSCSFSPQGRELRTADREKARGTAWNADLRSAQRPAGPRAVQCRPPSWGGGTGPAARERCLPLQCTDHAERWDSRREGATSELRVLPAARLRRAVPTRGRRSRAAVTTLHLRRSASAALDARWGVQEDPIMSVSPGGPRHTGPKVRGRRIAARLAAPTSAADATSGRGAPREEGRCVPPGGAPGFRRGTRVRVLPIPR